MDVRAWLDAYGRAWEQKDPGAAADLFADDATYRSNIYEQPHEGRDGVAMYWRDVTRTQEDVRVMVGTPFVDGDRVAAEFWTTMRNAGTEITLAGCLLLRFDDDGLCTALREYWQIEPGRLIPPPGWGDLPA